MAIAAADNAFDTKFRSFSEAMRAELRQLWPTLEPQVDRILRSVYSTSGFADVSRILDLQRSHFRQILQGQLDSSVVDLVVRVQEQHAAMGVDQDRHLAIQAGLLNEFSRLAVETHRRKPDRIIAATAALNQAILIDLDVAATLHIASLKAKATAERATLADRLEQEVRSVIAELTHSGQLLRGAAESMTHTADETNREAANVASEAESTTHNVQTVASAAEELSASIGEIARQVAQSSAIARKAADEAKRTDVTIEGLSNAASRIGEIVKLINSIAGQTNLLALNATIEAARAGEAGRGFAVVAQEVKNLATQTAQATEDITGQVAAIQSATNETVSVMRGIGLTITEINDIAAAIASAVGQQGSATNEIARNVQEAANGTTAVSNTIERVTRAAAETGSTAGRVLDTANGVNRQAETLDHTVASFLSHIRQA